MSVVIPTFNRADLIERAISTALRQHGEPEIVVVDDGSTDDTVTIVDGLAEPRLRYIRHGTNLGVSAARNTGVHAARADYIAFLDSDDEWLPGYLSSQLSVLSNGDKFGAVYCGSWAHDCVADIISAGPSDFRSGSVYADLLGGWSPHGPSVFVARRDLLLDAGLFDTRLNGYQDWDLFLRLAERTRFGVIRERLVIHHHHGGPRLMTTPELRLPALETFMSKWADEIVRVHSAEVADGFRRYHLRQIHAGAVHSAAARKDRAEAWRQLFAYVKAARPPRLRPPRARRYVGLLAAVLFGERWYRRTKKAFRGFRSVELGTEITRRGSIND